MLYHRGPNLLPSAVHELDYFGWKSSLEQNLQQQRSGMRDVLGGLEYHRVPANKRGEHLPGRNGHRKIERADQSGDSDRPAVAHRPFIAQLTRYGLSKKTPAFARRVVCRVDSLLNIAPGFSQRLSHLARHCIRDLFLALGHDVADYSEHVTAAGCRCAAPSRESARRALDGAIDVAFVGQRKFPDDVSAISRVSVVEIFTGLRGHPFSGDEVAEFFHFNSSLSMSRIRQLCSRESEYRSIFL